MDPKKQKLEGIYDYTYYKNKNKMFHTEIRDESVNAHSVRL